MAGVFQTLRGRWVEKRLSPSQPGRILPGLQRDRPAGDDVTRRIEVRNVFPLLFNRSAEGADHALRTTPSLPFALSNRLAGAERGFAECRARCVTVKPIPRL